MDILEQIRVATPGMTWEHSLHGNGSESWTGQLADTVFSLHKDTDNFWMAKFRMPFAGGFGDKVTSFNGVDYNILHRGRDTGRSHYYIPDEPGKGLELAETLYQAFMGHRGAYVAQLKQGLGL